jgi:YD repeat-containing protein
MLREQRGGAHPIDETLQYDGVGNRVSKVDASGTTTYQVNAANELVLTTPPTGAPTTSTWDADGNLAVENTGGQLTTHTWDTDHRLTRIDKPDGTWETNACRADGLRASHEDTDGRIYFIWDGQNVLLERNSSRSTRAAAGSPASLSRLPRFQSLPASARASPMSRAASRLRR